MTEPLGAQYLEDALLELRKYKRLAERAMEQVGDAELFRTLDQESNSIAIIMKHVAGNMRSRWTDFLTTDGEKPDRNRDSEFELDAGTSAAQVKQWWEEGWRCTFAALEPLAAADLERTVRIRGEPHTVMQAINRQLTHYAYHVGQIVYLAKHFRGPEFRSLSIPRGQSKAFEVARDGSPYLAGGEQR